MTDMFTPTETGRLLADSVGQALARRIPAPGKFDSRAAGSLWQDLAGLGLAGLELDPGHGGSGGTLADLSPALFALGRSLAVTPLVSTMITSALIEALGTPDQKQAWLPAMAEKGIVGAVAYEEEAGHSLSHFVETRARRVEAGWQLDGAKHVVADGGHASVFIVSARTSGEPLCMQGLSLFLVPAGTPGLKLRTFPLFDGCQAADMSLDGLPLPDDALLGREGEGFTPLEHALDRAAAMVCAEAVGVMDGLFELTLRHVRTREQFGQPIGKFQAIQHGMAELFIELELAKSMAGYAIASADNADSAGRRNAISAAKHVISNAARMIGQSAIQFHGAIALTDDYAAGHYFKRLTRIERQFGNASYHLDRFAGLISQDGPVMMSASSATGASPAG